MMHDADCPRDIWCSLGSNPWCINRNYLRVTNMSQLYRQSALVTLAFDRACGVPAIVIDYMSKQAASVLTSCLRLLPQWVSPDELKAYGQ